MERVLDCYYSCVINTSCIPIRLLQGRELNCVHKVPHYEIPCVSKKNLKVFFVGYARAWRKRGNMPCLRIFYEFPYQVSFRFHS